GSRSGGGRQPSTDREPSSARSAYEWVQALEQTWAPLCVRGRCEPGRFAVRWGPPTLDGPRAVLGSQRVRMGSGVGANLGTSMRSWPLRTGTVRGPVGAANPRRTASRPRLAARTNGFRRWSKPGHLYAFVAAANRDGSRSGGDRQPSTDREPSSARSAYEWVQALEQTWAPLCVRGRCEPGRFAVRWGPPTLDGPRAVLGS